MTIDTSPKIRHDWTYFRTHASLLMCVKISELDYASRRKFSIAILNIIFLTIVSTLEETFNRNISSR